MSNQYRRLNISTPGGGGGGGASDAINVDYDPSSSGLTAINVQAALDEIVSTAFVPRPLITLSGADITAGSKSIVITPNSPTLARLTVGGVRQTYGIDFTISGSTLSWSGLGLDGVLEAGDVLQLEIK